MITCRVCGRPQAKALCDRCRSARYNSAHRERRQLWAPIVAMGETECSRCGRLIAPADEWDLDHRSDGSRPSHASCNRSAGSLGLGT